MGDLGLQYAKFAVNDRPFCIWSDDLDDANRLLLQSFDAEYFTFQGRMFAPALETQDRQRAAVSLRSAYSHALETFFALLFAGLQAPNCVSAWLALYKPSDLPLLVGKVQSHQLPMTKIPVQKKDWDIRWSGIAATLMPIESDEDNACQTIRRSFGRMWTWFANDFLDQRKRAEYNWIKHGMRVAPGGFTLRMGAEPAFGVAPPEDEMRTVGASVYGCSAFVPEPIPDAPRQLRYRTMSSNWHPNNHIAGLTALSVSVANLLVFLKSYNRYENPGELTIPHDPAFYRSPWGTGVGVTHSSHALDIQRDDVKAFTDAEILAESDQERRTDAPS
jgi:hypothetical protein